MLYRDEYTDVVRDGSTQSDRADCGDHDADADRHVTGWIDEVKLVVDVDELLECRVGTQPDSSADCAESYQL